MKGSKNIEIYLVRSQTKDESKRNGKDRSRQILFERLMD